MSVRPLCVALTGGSGFVGRHVLRQLLAEGHQVRALVRRSSAELREKRGVEEVIGDLDNRSALVRLMAGADAVMHLVGIIMERPSRGQTFEGVHVQGTRHLLAAARQGRVERWVHMSALGARPGARSRYHQSKHDAEQAVQTSGLGWTILQPSIIHGPDGEFMRMVKRFCTKWLPPIIPYFGRGLLGRGGAGLLQPVWVEDVARCFVAALRLPAAQGQVYELGGPDRYTWPQLYEVCRRHLPRARAKPIAPIPAWLAMLMAHLPGAPFNSDQVRMSQEDNVCDTGSAQSDLGFTFAPFEATFAEYAGRIL